MGNATLENIEAHRTFADAAYEVLAGVVWLHLAALLALLFIAFLARAVLKAKATALQTALVSVFLSFALWPALFVLDAHVRQPGLFPAAVPSPKNFVVLVVLLNRSALLIPLLCVPIWLAIHRLSKRSMASAYVAVSCLLPLAWLLDCWSAGPR